MLCNGSDDAGLQICVSKIWGSDPRLSIFGSVLHLDGKSGGLVGAASSDWHCACCGSSAKRGVGTRRSMNAGCAVKLFRLWSKLASDYWNINGGICKKTERKGSGSVSYATLERR